MNRVPFKGTLDIDSEVDMDVQVDVEFYHRNQQAHPVLGTAAPSC